jgi:hypothetical protein
MKALTSCAVALSLFATAPLGADEPKKEDTPPVNIDRLDKAWNLKLKSVTVKDGTDRFRNVTKDVRLTLEFTKDVDDAKPIRRAFESEVAFEKLPPKEREGRVMFYFFDEDNVVLAKMHVSFPEGEITGKMGDAFRATVRFHAGTYAKVKKIELRMSEVAK